MPSPRHFTYRETRFRRLSRAGAGYLVYKLAKSFNPGDVVVYRVASGEYRIGIVVHQTHDDVWFIERNNGSAKNARI